MYVSFALYCLLKIGAIDCPIKEILYLLTLLYNRFFCMFGGTIWEDWSAFVFTTRGTKKGRFWMQRIAETVGEFLKGDWGRSRIKTGGTIGGHYCTTYKHTKYAHFFLLFESPSFSVVCLRHEKRKAGLSLESEWQQVSSSLQDFFLYSGQS